MKFINFYVAVYLFLLGHVWAQETITITNTFEKKVSFKVFVSIVYYKKEKDEQVFRDQEPIKTEKFVENFLDIEPGYSIQVPVKKLKPIDYVLKDDKGNVLENYVHKVDIRISNGLPAEAVFKNLGEYEIRAKQEGILRTEPAMRKRKFLCFNVLCGCFKRHDK